MYHAQFPDRVFQQLHHQLCETGSFYVIRCDTGRRRPARSPCLEESVLNAMADRPVSSTGAVGHHVAFFITKIFLRSVGKERANRETPPTVCQLPVCEGGSQAEKKNHSYTAASQRGQ
ncbi:hypothetical protein TNCV_3715471 [Trichonephila clavipes]|nr:hypothetical protein TNCV_3715471 [Trichonephila clavipes]